MKSPRRQNDLRLSLALLAALALWPDLSRSQASPASILNCADAKGDAARLKCYDALAASVRAAGVAAQPAAAAVAPARVRSPAAAVASEPKSSESNISPAEPNFGLQGDVLLRAQERASPHNSPSRKHPVALVAGVTRVSQRPGFPMSIGLDNGQVWEEAQEGSDILISLNDPVTIKPGVMGAFYLTDVTHRSIRVRRVR